MNQIININLIENRILSAIEKYDMINSVTDVVVGLSGGADSVMLAHFIKNRLNLNVYACHINHKLRGEESQRDMNFVRQFCCDNNIILDVYEIDVNQYAKENKLTVEQAGRQIRYNCFEETRCKYNAQKIATAHTLSDNAETFLLNVSRGAGVKGLCAIPPVRENIIRPIIFLSREQVESYCSYYNLSYVTDSTNLESVYTRNKIRHNVIPVIKQINNNFLSSINNTIDILQTENDFLDDLANKAYHIVKTEKGLDCSLLLSYHLALRRRIYMLFLQEYNLSVSMDLVDRIDNLLNLDNGKINVAVDIFIIKKQNILFILDNNEIPCYFEIEISNSLLDKGEFNISKDCHYTIMLCDKENYKNVKKVYKNFAFITLDYDKIIGKSFIRQKKSGDKIHLKGQTKSIKKIFIDKKLTQKEKSEVVIISDDNGVIAAYGFGVDDRVKIDEFTIKFLVVFKNKF